MPGGLRAHVSNVLARVFRAFPSTGNAHTPAWLTWPQLTRRGLLYLQPEKSPAENGAPAQSDGSLENLVGTRSTASRGRMQLAGLAIGFPIAVKARLLGIISAEFVAEELAGRVAPNLRLSVQDW
jgi:hypothetical protein